MKGVPPGRGSPLHSGGADPCEYPKCGYLGYTIFGSRGLRSRFPLTPQHSIDTAIYVRP